METQVVESSTATEQSTQTESNSSLMAFNSHIYRVITRYDEENILYDEKINTITNTNNKASEIWKSFSQQDKDKYN